MEIKITKIEEPWTVLHLEDGSVLKCRYSIAGVERVDGAFDQNGDPVYNLRGGQSVVLIPNLALRRVQTPLAAAPVAHSAGAVLDHDGGAGNARAVAEKLMRGGG